MTFDLSNIQSSDREVSLVNPVNGEELGLVFEIRSPESDEVQKVQREWQDRKLHPKRRNKPITSGELDALQDARIVASIKSWRWEDPDLVFNGEQTEFSEVVLKKWLRDHKWIRAFLIQETEDADAFFR